jgi:signal transduction histidine kinase
VSKLPPVGHLDHAPLVLAPLLFDAPRNRGLQQFEGRKIRTIPDLSGYRLDASFVPRTGIAVGIESAGGAGWIILTEIPGLASDHLRLVARLADEICRAISHHELVESLRRNDGTRLRLAVARNLHDGVVQSLAGARFRLESIRQGAAAGQAIVAELAQLQRALANEEARVGRFIAELRQSGETGHALRSVDHLSGVFTQVTDLWGIAGEFATEGDCESLPQMLIQEIEPVVREAVSNAVRHGKATNVRCALRREGTVLHLELADNGGGMQGQNESPSPQSILARVTALGGTMATNMHDGGTRIAIDLPMEAIP